MEAKIMFFPNGNTAVLRDGAQQPQLQRPWVELFAEFLESQGEDPEACDFTMPDGQLARFFRTADGWRWRFD